MYEKRRDNEKLFEQRNCVTLELRKCVKKHYLEKQLLLFTKTIFLLSYSLRYSQNKDVFAIHNVLVHKSNGFFLYINGLLWQTIFAFISYVVKGCIKYFKYKEKMIS